MLRSTASIRALRAISPLIASAIALLAFPIAADAAIGMSKTGNTVTITGDGGNDTLVIDTSGGQLRHNHSGDAGFASDVDFDSNNVAIDDTVVPGTVINLNIDLGPGTNSVVLDGTTVASGTWTIGSSSLVSPLATVNYGASVGALAIHGGASVDTVKVLASAAGTPITIDGGLGGDTIVVGSAAGKLATILGEIRLTGADSTDSLSLDDSTAETGRSFALDQAPGRTTISSAGLGLISWDGSVTSATINGGLGKDRITLNAPPATPTAVSANLGSGEDGIKLLGTTNLGGGSFNGGSDTDFIDFSSQTAGVTYNAVAGVPGKFGPSTGVEVYEGSSHDDNFVGNDVNESFNLGAGNDTVDAGGGDDTVTGGAGSDTITGGAGADKLYSGTGGDGGVNDVAANTLNGGAGNDQLEGSNGTDTITGGDGDDQLKLYAGADTADGGAGNDTITEIDGAAVVNGGDGFDTASFEDKSLQVIVSLDDKANDGVAKQGANVATTIERLIGGNGSDILTGSAGGDVIEGGTGNDVITGGLGTDTLWGEDGDDRFLAGTAANRAVADGTDRMHGGAGLDYVVYAGRTKPVHVTFDNKANDGSAKERDQVREIENAIGGKAADVLIGDKRANVLAGGSGNDKITGGAGKDTLLGEAGNDILAAKDGAKDVVNGGAGKDRATFDTIDKRISIP